MTDEAHNGRKVIQITPSHYEGAEKHEHSGVGFNIMKDEIKQTNLGVAHMGPRGSTYGKCCQNGINPPSGSI